MPITIKDHTVLAGMMRRASHPVLIDLCVWFVVRYSNTVFTCAFEERDYPSVHSTDPLRGMDVRSTVFKNPQAVADDVNNNWIYDPGRPWLNCAVYHDMGRGAHIHLQVCDKTVPRD